MIAAMHTSSPSLSLVSTSRAARAFSHSRPDAPLDDFQNNAFHSPDWARSPSLFRIHAIKLSLESNEGDLLGGCLLNKKTFLSLVHQKRRFLEDHDGKATPFVPHRPAWKTRPDNSVKDCLPETSTGAMMLSECDDNDLLGQSRIQDSPQKDDPPIVKPPYPLDQRFIRSRLASPQKPGSSRLVIGIDYGTTYTGQCRPQLLVFYT